MTFFAIVWLSVLVIDNVLPFLLAPFYREYRHKTMALSVLGCRQSPVKWTYNVWCIVSGLIFCFGAYHIYTIYESTGALIAGILLLLYGIGCEIMSGLFPLDENRKESDLFSKIHGAGSAPGFTALLFVPLVLGILQLSLGSIFSGVVCIILFAISFVFFLFFIMGEKERFKNSPLAYGGLWQRACLAICYIPIGIVITLH